MQAYTATNEIALPTDATFGVRSGSPILDRIGGALETAAGDFFQAGLYKLYDIAGVTPGGAPTPEPTPAPEIEVVDQKDRAGDIDTKTLLIIGGGVLAAILLVAVVLK